MHHTISENDKIPETPIILSPKSFSLDILTHNLYQHGYAYVKDFLNNDLLETLLNHFKMLDINNNLQKAKIGREKNHQLSVNIRNDKTCWITGHNFAEQKFLKILDDLRIKLNKQLILGLFDVEAHYAIYEKGGFYRRHLDSFKGKNNRVISLVIYFNKNWHISDGGLLQLYNSTETQETLTIITPEYNHAVFFLSETIQHEVTMSHRNRLSISCWFRCRDIYNMSLI